MNFHLQSASFGLNRLRCLIYYHPPGASISTGAGIAAFSAHQLCESREPGLARHAPASGNVALSFESATSITRRRIWCFGSCKALVITSHGRTSHARQEAGEGLYIARDWQGPLEASVRWQQELCARACSLRSHAAAADAPCSRPAERALKRGSDSRAVTTALAASRDPTHQPTRLPTPPTTHTVAQHSTAIMGRAQTPSTPLPALPPAFLRSYRLMQVRAAAATVALLIALVIVVGSLASLVLPQLPMALLLVELVFYVVYRRRKAALDLVPDCHEPPNHDGWVPFRKFMASSRHIAKNTTIGELLKCWFGNVKESDIKRDNVADLLCYGFWYRTRETMESLGLGHVALQMVDMVEEAWGFKFEEGLNPDLKYMTHIWEPLKCNWRPLCFYALMEVGALIKHVQMLASGFSCYSHAGFTYYTHGMDAPGQAARPQQAANPRTPFLFTHGVGAGLLPYIPFVQRLACTGHPVIAVEFRHLAMRWTTFLPSVDEVAQAVGAILRHQGLSSVGVVAHSYGTFYASRIVQLYPEVVQALCIVDPVTTCMWSGHLMANFVYHPQRSTAGSSIWLIARDIHSAACVSRHFYWTQYNLWPDMLPERTLVVLSGRDDLVPIRHVERMLRKETRAHVVLHPHHAHADFTFDQKWQEEVLVTMMKKLYGGLEGAPSSGSGSSVGGSCGSSVVEGSGSDSEAAPLVRVLPLGLETKVVEAKVVRSGPAAAAGRRMKAA